jgi:hypothetical protein
VLPALDVGGGLHLNFLTFVERVDGTPRDPQECSNLQSRTDHALGADGVVAVVEDVRVRPGSRVSDRHAQHLPQRVTVRQLGNGVE